MLVSFVIPIYNGEKYLTKCIDSLINQDIESDDYEVICVDDCSSDSSVLIIKQYQKTNKNIKLIENAQNLKTGSTCNVGLENAQGEYVWFIGQDDWIEKKCLKNITQKCVGGDLNLMTFNYKRVDFEENDLHSADVFDNSAITNGADYILTKFGNAFPHYLLGYEWRAIFNREFLKHKNIRFPDDVIYEDTTFLFKAILYAERFRSISDFLYFYRVNSESITDFNKKYKGNLVFEFAFKAGNEVLDLALKIKETHTDFSLVLLDMAKWYFNGFAHKVIAASFSEKIKFYNNLSTNYDLVVKTRKYLRIIAYLLSIKLFGLTFSVFLKPFYLFKKKIFVRSKRKQEWSY
ncbi:MAG: glycosyltransferase family 2 protein [Paludibacter sp.]